jgi:chemotaxis protein histidine kinase CheA
MDAMAAIKQTFFQECEEQLGELEIGLLVLQDEDTDPETVNAVFRAVHSIKGGAGAFNLDELVHFAHVFENVLDHLRAGRLAASGDVLKTMLRAADMLADFWCALPATALPPIRGDATRSPPNSAPSIPRPQARISTVAIKTATAMT